MKPAAQQQDASFCCHSLCRGRLDQQQRQMMLDCGHKRLYLRVQLAQAPSLCTLGFVWWFPSQELGAVGMQMWLLSPGASHTHHNPSPQKSDCSSKAEQCYWNVNWGPEYPRSPSPLNEQIEFIWALTAPLPLPLGRTEASIVCSASGFAAICFRDLFFKEG